MLCRKSNLHEILWNFGRFKGDKRLTLKQNPHFYRLSDLTTWQTYGSEFEADPIDTFQHAKIGVLTDKPGRIFLETDQSKRAFGNAWMTKKAIIFKGSQIAFFLLPSFHDVLLDVCGKVEGESRVHASIRGAPKSWYLEEPPLSSTSLPAVLPTLSSPLASSTLRTVLTTSALGGPFKDWREPIRQRLSSHTSIRVRGLPCGNSISSPPAMVGSSSATVTHRGSQSPRMQPPPTTRFQLASFEMYMESRDRSHRNQATALISICQMLVQSREQSADSDARLRL